jgi:hypothetical protein
MEQWTANEVTQTAFGKVQKTNWRCGKVKHTKQSGKMIKMKKQVQPSLDIVFC